MSKKCYVRKIPDWSWENKQKQQTVTYIRKILPVPAVPHRHPLYYIREYIHVNTKGFLQQVSSDRVVALGLGRFDVWSCVCFNACFCLRFCHKTISKPSHSWLNKMRHIFQNIFVSRKVKVCHFFHNCLQSLFKPLFSLLQCAAR